MEPAAQHRADSDECMISADAMDVDTVSPACCSGGKTLRPCATVRACTLEVALA